MPSEGAKHAAVTHPGDLVRLEYDLWAEGGGRTDLIDTTHHEVAQEAKVPETTGQVWGARPHQIGGDYFPTGVENALIGLAVGEEVEKEFAPADAFGERDPKLIELYSMHEVSRLPEMRREDAHLDIGTVLTIEGRRGRVITLTQARVRVDFNPPFAGKKIRAKFKVTDRVTEAVDQVKAIVELQYGRSAEFHVEVHDKVVTLKVPERSKFDISWMAAKPRVIDRIRTQVHPHSVHIVEEYVTPATEKPASEKAEPAEKKADGTPPGKTEGKPHESKAHEPKDSETKSHEPKDHETKKAHGSSKTDAAAKDHENSE
jgi:FKBP-type peptidyl-prolyl cis-trans isomerase 2